MPRLLNSRTVRSLTVGTALLVVSAPAALAAKPDHPSKPEHAAKPEHVEKPEHATAPKHAAKPDTAAVATGACAERAFSKVFASYRDNALYTLAPDGDFEAGAADWTLADGAAVADESSSIQLGAALGAQALSLPAGSSATTPEICVAHGFPTFRFAARSAGDARGVLQVQVLYGAGRKSKKTGRIKAAAAWKVTRKLSLAQG